VHFLFAVNREFQYFHLSITGAVQLSEAAAGHRFPLASKQVHKSQYFRYLAESIILAADSIHLPAIPILHHTETVSEKRAKAGFNRN
jgi:hypothetical protein